MRDAYNMKKILCFLLLTIIISGCEHRIDASCSSQDAQSLISQIIHEEAGKPIIELKNRDGDPLLSPEKVEELLSKVTVSLEQVRTTNRDPNSTKASCSGTLVIIVPQDMLFNAEKSRSRSNMNTLSDYAKSLDIEIATNKFSHVIEYYVQPTDDRKSIYAALTKSEPLSKMLGEIATSYLLEPFVEAKIASQVKEAQAEMNNEEVPYHPAPAAETDDSYQHNDVQKIPDNSKAQQENAELSRYKAKDTLDEANKQINIVWNATTKAIRVAILPEQREWLKLRENKCSLKASIEEPNNIILQDAIRLNCMAVMTDQRTEELKQKITSMTQN